MWTRGASSAALGRSLAAIAAGCALTAGCSSAPAKATAPSAQPVVATIESAPVGPPLTFQWRSARAAGEVVSSEALQGRVTVLVFVTTYDVPSQIEVRFLARLLRDHAPRLNGVTVVMEPPENEPLVTAYAASLEGSFAVAVADAPTVRGEGAFAGLRHVPAFAILDKSGRERFRHLGPLSYEQLEAAVRKVEDTK